MLKMIKRPLLVTLAILAVVEALIVWGYGESRQRAEQFLAHGYIAETALFHKTVIQHYSDLEKVLMREFVEKKEIRELMYRASRASNEAERARIRAELDKETRSLYEWLDTEYGIRQFHFHLPDTTSFLRLHQPKKFGDSLAKTRYSVVLANREKRSVQGFEEGKIFNGFRFVNPLAYNGEHVGTVELSFGFDTLNEWMSKVSETYNHMIIKRSVVGEHVFAEEQNRYSLSNLSPDYMHEQQLVTKSLPHIFEEEGEGHRHVLNHTLFQEFNTQLAPQIRAELPEGKSFVRWAQHGSDLYAVTFIPLINVKQEHTGYLISYFPDHMMEQYLYLAHRVFIAALSIPVLIWAAFIYIVYLREKERQQVRYQEQLIHKIETLNASLQTRVEEGVQELRNRDHIMLQQSKLASMGEMIGNIAHQWRQPLNALALKIQDIEDAYAFGELNEAYIQDITSESMKQIQFMSKTIDDFRQFFLPDKQKEHFEENTAIEEALQMVRFGLERHGISVEWSPERLDKHVIYGFKNEFKQVLINLFKNAEDALVEKNAKMEPGSFHPAIFIRSEHSGNEYRLVIEDNAGGIPSDIIERIFEPYFTTKEEGKGTGIGLYMSKMIIERNMGGTLVVTNSERGATFTISLEEEA